MVLRLVILVVTLLVSPVAIADRVLLAGTGPGVGTIHAQLQALGHAVVRTDSDSLPANLSSFDTVWVHTLSVLAPADIGQLAAFVESGKGVYLNGVGLPASAGNANAEALVDATVIDGASITIGAANCPFVFNGIPNTSAVNRIATVPHAPAYMAFAAAGCISGAAPSNQVITGTGGIRVGAWRDADMMGGQGRIAVVMDANWASLGDPWSDEWVANLQQFLKGTLFASGFEVEAPAADGILRCDSPADGALVDLVPGAPIAVTGTALGLSNVQVNGIAVAVAPDQTFSAPVTGRYGLNFVALSATDGAGAPQTTLCAFLGAARWVTEGAQYDDALLFRLEPAGLTKLTTIYPPWFAGPNLQQSLNTSLLAGNPVYSAGCPLSTCITEMRYLSLAISFDNLNIAVNVDAESMTIAVQLDLRMRVRVRRQFGGINLGNIDGDVLFTNSMTTIEFKLGVDLFSGRPIVSSGTVIGVNGGTVSLQFPGLESEFANEVKMVAADVLFGRLGPLALSGASGLFEGLFAGFEVSPPAAGFPVGRLDGTANVMVALAPRSSVDLQTANPTGTGNRLRLGTSLRVTLPAPPPNATGRFPLPPPSEPLATRLETDAWSAVHVGTYNQVLQALWRVGLFDGTLDGAALDPGLPAGTAVSLQMRTMPVVTGFEAGDNVGLDLGALDLVVTHPGLPPGLRVAVGARMRAHAAFVADDLVCDNIVVNELRIATGTLVLDAASQATLQGLVETLLVKIAGVALNDSLPVLPATRITYPPSLAAYGLPVGEQLLATPIPVIEPDYVYLQGRLNF